MNNYLCNRHGKRLGTFPTYYEAVKEGQRTLGYGEFEVQTPNRTPTREEQLLLQPPTTISRKELLASI